MKNQDEEFYISYKKLRKATFWQGINGKYQNDNHESIMDVIS